MTLVIIAFLWVPCFFLLIWLLSTCADYFTERKIPVPKWEIPESLTSEDRSWVWKNLNLCKEPLVYADPLPKAITNTPHTPMFTPKMVEQMSLATYAKVRSQIYSGQLPAAKMMSSVPDLYGNPVYIHTFGE